METRTLMSPPLNFCKHNFYLPYPKGISKISKKIQKLGKIGVEKCCSSYFATHVWNPKTVYEKMQS